MERSIYLVFLLSLFMMKTFAQTNYKLQIYNCFINGNMTEWKNIIDEIKAQESNALRLELINYQYGYIGWCLGNENEKTAKTYLQKAINNVSILEEKDYQKASLYAYKSAFWGFKISLAFYKAPFLGPESIKFAKKSIKLDSTNYLGYIQLGNIKHYTPPAFGGSKTQAIAYYLKAIELIEKQTLYNDWNYLSLLITTGQTYEEIKNYLEAKKYYQKVLDIEPDFDWVKNKLMVELNKKL